MRPSLPVERLRLALRAWGLADADLVEIVPGATADVFLVLLGDGRWVAKLAYDRREYFEVGLRASQIVHDRIAGPQLEVCIPVPTASGALTEQVEWPDGVLHPLAVLTYVRGDPLPTGDPDAPRVLGDVCGRVHAALLDVTRDDVGLDLVRHDETYVDVDLGRFTWLHELCVEIDQQTTDLRSATRHSIAVWDGPDIRRTRASTGILDFGHCGWHPLAHVVANRSLNAALTDVSRLEPFLDAVGRHLPLTTSELELIPLYRLLNAAIYARWVAMERIRRHDPTFNDLWFRDLLTMLRRESPRLGIDVPE